MVNSAKRARRRKLAQEAQRREGSCSAHQMDPADLSRPGTDEDEEKGREIAFVPRMEREEEPPPVPNTVQAAPNCEIINMVKPPFLRTQNKSGGRMITCTLITLHGTRP